MRLRHLVSIVFAASLVAAPALAQRRPTPPVPPAPPAQQPPAPPAVPPAPPAPPSGRYQGGNEQTERITRKVKLGRQGSVTISNIAGDIIVTGGTGDEVSIEAVKRTHGDRAQLADLQIVVDERPGRVEIRQDFTRAPRESGGEPPRHGRFRGNDVAVDFTVTIPSDASVDLHSVSGDLKVTGVQGMVRAESVSGAVTATKSPHVERAKSVSGNVDLSDVTSDGDLAAGSISGTLRAKSVKTRSLDLNTVSGDVTLTSVTCERVGIRSVSGNIEYDGPLARSGRYELNSHSGNVRIVLASNTGFELNASSFSGSIRSDVPLTIGGAGSGAGAGAGRGSDRGEVRHRGMGQSMRATYGDGSAMLTIRTFSGDVTIAKK